MFSNRSHLWFIWATGALFLIALSRFLLLPSMTFDQDEVWSVWLTFGALPDVIARTDTNWSVWFNFLAYIWRLLVGAHPYAMRMLSLLLFMLSAALTYQLGRQLYKRTDAALLGLVAYAGLGYMVYFSLYVRPYALAIPLVPLGLIFVIRYFEKPTFKRALILALHMAAMFYVSLMAIFPFIVFLGFSLFRYGRKVWRWWLVGLIAVIAALPEILNKAQIVLARTAFTIDSPLPPLPQGLWTMFSEYTGSAFILWLLLIALALLFIPRFARQYRGVAIWCIIWAVLGTYLLYWLHPRTGLFRFRYAWWIAWALPLFLAYGLAQLPLWAKRMTAILLLAMSFIVSPEAISAYKEPIPDVESLFEWFHSHYEAGDVLVIDPNTRMASADFRTEVWDYYSSVFFENGLSIVTSPSANAQRVWYLHTQGRVDEQLQATIQAGRLESIFYGSSGFQIKLYAGAPNPEGILFANGLRFHGVEILDGESLANLPLVMPKGSQLRLRLWWSVDAPLSQEYSVGIKVMSPRWEGVYAQEDSAPQAIYLLPYFNEMLEPFGNMTTWQTGQYYVEERSVYLPFAQGLQRTPFTVYLTVYQWQDGTRIPASGTNADDLLPLFNFTLMAW